MQAANSNGQMPHDQTITVRLRTKPRSALGYDRALNGTGNSNPKIALAAKWKLSANAPYF